MIPPVLGGISRVVVSVAYSKAQLRSGGNGRAPDVRPPEVDEVQARASSRRRELPSIELISFVALAWLAVAWLAIASYSPGPSAPPTTVVVERIIRVESNGNTKAKNPRSSATGAGQIIDQTWIEMIQRHKQDLLVGRSRNELLDLRTDTALTREIVAHMVEGNAKTLKKRGLPVTPGTLYLAHFAGSAGAVALLTSPDHLDAATTMAAADSTGRSSREQLVKANPFLATFTVGDLKSWADRKMRG